MSVVHSCILEAVFPIVKSVLNPNLGVGALIISVVGREVARYAIVDANTRISAFAAYIWILTTIYGSVLSPVSIIENGPLRNAWYSVLRLGEIKDPK